MTIREMCNLYQVTPRTLRFYEAKELLFPHRQGQKRLFTRRDRARMTLIERGKRLGFSLEQIRQLLEVYDKTRDERLQLEMAQRLATKRLAEMERDRTEMEGRMAELKAQIAYGTEMLRACAEAMVEPGQPTAA
ncbi:MerR family transcriptional regulator [Neogemmobacter tilapiae]|uniref:MerR family transcriptional regulator n=1 Tax=Neogemmobacter tilapiae TaxID=875041 RepID=A0A918WHW6_9RHOB|nr:MerR family DNA-binding transcriptional regulator [Gemmobacter tilapiae]GHC47766.1 MerR family transcriptional regulator [Gemmobacter tilapiae]